MFSYTGYKVLHMTGVFMVILALGGLAMHAINGGTKANPWRRPVAITHGIGMLFSLVGGFGLLAYLGAGFPLWAIIKLLIWLYFGLAIAILNRRPQSARGVWFVVIVLAGFAAYLGNAKPF